MRALKDTFHLMRDEDPEGYISFKERREREEALTGLAF
jgi:hypothetical protein